MVALYSAPQLVENQSYSLKIAIFPDLCVRAEIKMLTYSHICCAFYSRPSLTSEKISNF
jgi:hypothetical protein